LRHAARAPKIDALDNVGEFGGGCSGLRFGWPQPAAARV